MMNISFGTFFAEEFHSRSWDSWPTRRSSASRQASDWPLLPDSFVCKPLVLSGRRHW